MSRRLLALAALIAGSALTFSNADAQLGKLTKKATSAAAGAAGVPTGNARSVKKIDLTSAQLAQINKGLESAVKTGPETIKRWEKAQADYEKAMEEYNKKHEKWNACVESEKEKARGKIEAANQRSNQAGETVQKSVDTATIMAQAQAAQAAAERVKNGTATAADRQTLADFQKTMAGVSGNANAAAAAMQESGALQQAVSDSIKRKCGEEPQRPVKSASGSRAGNAGAAAPTTAAEEINQTSAAAAGMTEDEYRLLKEKAMGYAASNTEVQGGTDTPPDEAKSINSELAQTRDLMAQANKANVPLM